MFLCIDTTTECAGVALVGDIDQCRFQKLDAWHASDKILETIDQVIQKADIQLSDLKGVMVIKGPGSFTGLRVGIAVANQFAHQLKIPIVGLRTEEWYQYRTDEKNFIYLQAMNRDQVYMAGFGKYERDYPPAVISISECHYELMSGGIKWMGEVGIHEKHLSDLPKITKTLPPDKTWKKIASHNEWSEQQKYKLVEPFYGKEPTITKSKRKLGM